MDNDELLLLIQESLHGQSSFSTKLYDYISDVVDKCLRNHPSFKARRLTAEDLEDLSQNIKVKMSQKGLKNFKGTTVYQFLAYVKKIAENELIDFFRANVQQLTELDATIIDEQQASQDDTSESSELFSKINAIAQEYGTETSQALWMKVKGYTIEEVSNMMNIPKSTLESRFERIGEKMRERYPEIFGPASEK